MVWRKAAPMKPATMAPSVGAVLAVIAHLAAFGLLYDTRSQLATLSADAPPRQLRQPPAPINRDGTSPQSKA